MSEKIIDKKKVTEFVSKLKESYIVFGPVEKDGEATFAHLNSDSLMLEYKNTEMSPKEIFFTQTETLFNYTKSPDGVKLEEKERETEKPILLFGVRACDVRALKLLDKVFSSDYKDSSYLDRRKNSVTIALACSEPQNTCFCTSIGGSPNKAEADILFTSLGEHIYAEGFTEKGDEILGFKVFKKITQKDKNAKEKRVLETEKKMEIIVDMQQVVETIGETFEKPYWDEISKKCVNCFACTFFCPTCHCFDITDVKRKGGGERLRTWDSCMSSLFTLHASGHNPRRESYRRWRQRVFHKFKYIPDNLGILGCVGCGRCIAVCPTGMDIRQILRLIITYTNSEIKNSK